MSNVFFVLYFYITIQYSETANILAIFPTPSISHQVVFRPLMHELVKRGHRVTIITTDPAFNEKQRPANLTEIDVHDISYKIWQEYALTANGDDNNLEDKSVIFLSDLQSYLDKSTKGVVYMSFGSIIQTSLFSQEIIELFIDVFSKLPYNVLIKWDSELPGCPDNVKVGKWFPQTDLLRHKNVKLFITHVGYQSMSESIDAGIPIVGIPMAADEWYNMELCLKHGIGIKLDFKYLTKENIKGAINTVIGNECYRDNIIRLRNLIHDQPQSPLDLAVWWTEYVLRHGGATHLRSAAAHMRWTEYYEINLILCLLLLILIFTFSIIYSVKLFVNKLVSGQFISTNCTPNTATQRCDREKMQ
ncbi:UDP-glucosyltransferase 2-like [Bicyclus anynana]|uniref:UDP-glucosyltransferase 2-like n=1 Tax=Bicyclus anynana TaxID=110368 RepID=A0ABM3LPR7_BICAN|nr:UDP-glucosyltransferase 2-like [Bicyclus anynana]